LRFKGWKKGLSGILLLSLIVSISDSTAYAANDQVVENNSPAAEQTDQVIVKLKKPQTKSTVGSYQVVENAVGGDQSLVSVEVPSQESTADSVQKIDSRTDVEYAEPDYRVKLTALPNDPYFSKQWQHKAIQTSTAWNVTKGSSDVIVAVIDDGIDPKHPELAHQLVAPYDVVNDTNQSIQVGEHGTHVSGIIAAAANNGEGGSGIAPNVKIMPINVFRVDDTGQEGAYTSDIIKGIDYATDHGAKIINMSLGTYQNSEALNEAIQRAYKRGVIVIAAAGNNHSATNSYPAAYDHVISVASTDSNDQISSFSNYGNSIDIAAPGRDILSTLPNDKYGYMSGTSMAAPAVSGVAALIWSAHPNYTATQVTDTLLDSADDFGSYGKDPIYGWGRVDAARAVTMKLLAAPVVNQISDRDQVMTGNAAADIVSGQVIVSNGQGIIGRAPLDSNHQFTVKNIPLQKAGTVLQVQVVDGSGNRSLPVAIKVIDRTPPRISKVYPVSNLDTTVKGLAEANSKIVIKKGSTVIGTAVTGANQQFIVKIPKQAAAAKLSVAATDSSNNQSPATAITVIDRIPPKVSKVYPVSNRDTAIKGISEAHSRIVIKRGSTVIATVITGTNQQFTAKIPKQAAAAKLSIVAVDSSNNQSTAVVVTVADRIAPRKPAVHKVTNRSTRVTGTTEAYAKVIVKAGKYKLSEAKANSKGYFSVKIKRERRGTHLNVYAYDHSSNYSYTSIKVN